MYNNLHLLFRLFCLPFLCPPMLSLDSLDMSRMFCTIWDHDEGLLGFPYLEKTFMVIGFIGVPILRIFFYSFRV